MPEFQSTAEPLTREGVTAVLERLGLKVPELLAVVTVETNGCGFLPDRRPQILFERHIFSGLTEHRFDATHPGISSTKPGNYAFGEGEYPRLAAAIELDRNAALQSASWGIGQVMGFNFKAAGYDSVQNMVEKAVASEDEQLSAMANFLIGSSLHKALAVHDWTSFARVYNGSNFAENRYDTRLAAAFQHYSQGAIPDITVRTAQLLLSYAGFKPGPIDGMPGKMTRNAVQLFRQAKGLGDSDQIDDDLIVALRHALAPASAAFA